MSERDYRGELLIVITGLLIGLFGAFYAGLLVGERESPIVIPYQLALGSRTSMPGSPPCSQPNQVPGGCYVGTGEDDHAAEMHANESPSFAHPAPQSPCRESRDDQQRESKPLPMPTSPGLANYDRWVLIDAEIRAMSGARESRDSTHPIEPPSYADGCLSTGNQRCCTRTRCPEGP